MMPKQRLIVYELFRFWQQWGYAPSMEQLAKATHFTEDMLPKEIDTLAKMGLVSYTLEKSDRGYDFIKAKLTQKAESMVPRIQELMQ